MPAEYIEEMKDQRDVELYALDPENRCQLRLEDYLARVLLSEVFLEKTSNIDIRLAAGVALLFNPFMVAIALVAIARTVPKDEPRTYRWWRLPPIRELDCSRCRVFCAWRIRCAIAAAILLAASSPLAQVD
ncbi:MAG: hypothetical protein WB676_10905 [Bryobacteraceae bacterium]